jgi:acyl carrier protein
MEEGEERLVIVQEIERSHRDKDLTGVITAIRRAISSTHELQAYAILLLRPGQIFKTSSGKVQRGAVRDAFVAGRLSAVHEWRFSRELEESPTPTLGDEASIAELQGWIAARLAAAVGTEVEAIDVNEPFARYGLDSMQAVVIAEEIGQRLGREISAALFWDYPTVAELARQLATPGEVSSDQ